jgi:ribosomal protein S27AE
MPGLDDLRRPAAAVRINLALEELKKRGVANDYCPRCNTFDWSVDINDVPATSAMAQPSLPPIQFQTRYSYNRQSGPVISMLSIVCKNCGYTMFHNMGILEPR